jgi:hypothetical protein
MPEGKRRFKEKRSSFNGLEGSRFAVAHEDVFETDSWGNVRNSGRGLAITNTLSRLAVTQQD